MKKVISILLLLALCIGCFAGCANNEEDPALEAAKEYLYTMYKDSDLKTTVDYTVVSQVRVDDVVYPITWTANVSEDLVKITAGENSMTIIDINEAPSEDVNYTLTGTLTNAEGKTTSVSFEHMIPKGLSMVEIVNEAYKLETGKTMEGIWTLTGVISTIDTPYSADYKNITVTIKVTGAEDKPMMCYRLKGEGADALKIGDTITVKGTIKNYNGSIQFDSGCELLKVVAGNVEQKPGYDPTGKTPAEIIDAAYGLESGEAMTAEATLTGVISSVDTAWDDNYKNITVTIKVSGKEDKPIKCYRMKGDGAKDLKVGDTITCTGIIKNYMGEVEFDAGCKVSNIVPGKTEPTPSTPSITLGASVTYDFSGVGLAGEGDYEAMTNDEVLAEFNKGASGAGLAGVVATKVQEGNNSDGGAFPNQGGFLKAGSSKNAAQLVLTFNKKVAKVEIVCHGWKNANSDKISVNGSATQYAPVTGTTNPTGLVFNLDTPSEEVTIDIANRAFVFKIIVTFVG